MEFRRKSDNRKIIAALICLFIGFILIWNIAAHTAGIYELYLNTETCQRVKTLGLAPSDSCVITAPFRPFGLVPGGDLVLPDGSDIQIFPTAVNRTNKGAEWSTSMKAQLWVALLFWVATLALLLSVFRSKE